MSRQQEPRTMTYDRLLDERVNLQIQINLAETSETTSAVPVDRLKEQLAEVEGILSKQRKLDLQSLKA